MPLDTKQAARMSLRLVFHSTRRREISLIGRWYKNNMQKKIIFHIITFFILSTFSLHAMDESVSLLEVAINDYNKAQYAFAINNLTKYLQIAESDDNKPTAYYYLSLSYYFTNDYKMSMKYFNELISRYRSSSYSSLSHFWIGLISQNLGEWEEADESFYKYVALYPHSDIADKAYLAAANCRLAMGRYEETEETLRTLIKKYPKSDKYEESSVLFAYILMCNGKNDEAMAFLERWVNLTVRTWRDRRLFGGTLYG